MRSYFVLSTFCNTEIIKIRLYYFFLQQLKQERSLQITKTTNMTKHSFIATIKFDGQLSDSPNHVFISKVLQQKEFMVRVYRTLVLKTICCPNEISTPSKIHTLTYFPRMIRLRWAEVCS